jgi:hypothetical protein
MKSENEDKLPQTTYRGPSNSFPLDSSMYNTRQSPKLLTNEGGRMAITSYDKQKIP